MKDNKRADQRFQDLLEGRSPSASPEIEGMAKLAAALGAAATPGPSPQFRRRLRNELLAHASMSEEDLFAAAFDGGPMEAPEEIRQLVTVASALEPARLPTPDPAFRFRLRTALVEHAPELLRPSIGTRLTTLNSRMLRSFRAVGAMAMAVVMLLGSSLALAAAQDAIPGDALYGLKRLHETARLLPMSGADEGRARLALARVRLAEVDALHRRGVVTESLYIGTLDDMDRSTTSGAELLLDAYRAVGDRALVDHLALFAADQVRELSSLIPLLPPGVRPAARSSLAVAERTATEAERVLSDCICPGDPLFTTPTARVEGRGLQGPACPCAVPPSGSTSGGTPPPGGGSDTSPPSDEPPGPDPDDDPAVQLPDELPDEIKEPAEELLNDLIDVINDTPLPLPSPLPTLPGLDDLGL